MLLTHQKYFQYSPFFVDATAMSDSNWERLNMKIDRLPQALVDILVDISASEFVENLTQKYIQLSVQGPDVARLIRDIVIGDIFIGDMPKEISNRLGVDSVLARDVANQIVSQLFTPVIEDIKKAQNERYPGRLPAKPATPPEPTAAKNGLSLAGQAPQKYPGQELPESGGNIIDLRNK